MANMIGLGIGLFVVIFSVVYLVAVAIPNMQHAWVEKENAERALAQSQKEVDAVMDELNESIDDVSAMCDTGEITGC